MKLSIKNLSFAYTEETVLKNINLTLDKKEFLVIVGKSGCGKTTLLRTIAGLESISQGSIEIDDVDVTFKDPKTRDISYVMQEYPLYPNLSVFDNISFGLKNKRLRLEQLETKVYEISKTLDVYKLLNEKPKHLSFGERQRVCLAKALISEPKILLFDEPLSNLDHSRKIELRLEILNLYHKLNIPFIYVTHDQDEALHLATKILFMDEGKIIQLDHKDEIINHPINLKVADFFANPKLNIFSAKLDESTLDIEGIKKLPLTPIFKDIFSNRKDMLIGVKPENIIINKKGSFSGVVIGIERQISTYLYEITYDKEKSIYIRTNETLALNDLIHFDLVEENFFFFDIHTYETLDLYHYINRFLVDSSKITLFNKTINISNYFNVSFFKSIIFSLYINIPNDSISLLPNDSFYQFEITNIDYYSFNQKHTYKLYIKGTNEYLFIVLDNYTDPHLIKDIYIDPSKLIYTDENNLNLTTKLPIKENETIIQIKSNKHFTKLKLGKNTYKFNRINHQDGKYIVKFSHNLNILDKFSNRTELNKNIYKYTNNHIFKASAYDEDIINNNHIIYVKIPGFSNYVTLKTDKLFSVYNYPEIIVSFDLNDIEFITEIE